MASSSGSDENLQQLMDQRKRKRMQSNRESARRSRMRKQKHVDDLTAVITQMTNENNQILKTIHVTKQHLINVEAENSVLRAQMMELTQRLNSLNEILDYMNSGGGGAAVGGGGCVFEAEELGFGDGFWSNPWSLMGNNNQQPIMASANMFDYC